MGPRGPRSMLPDPGLPHARSGCPAASPLGLGCPRLRSVPPTHRTLPGSCSEGRSRIQPSLPPSSSTCGGSSSEKLPLDTRVLRRSDTPRATLSQPTLPSRQSDSLFLSVSIPRSHCNANETEQAHCRAAVAEQTKPPHGATPPSAASPRSFRPPAASVWHRRSLQ